MTTRMLDLYAMHPEAIPPEYATMEMVDHDGQRLEIGDYIHLDGMGACRITGREGAWIYLDQGGDPAVAFVAELQDGVAVRP